MIAFDAIKFVRKNQPPTCSLYADPKSGDAPLTVTFYMSANDPDGSISAWVLDVNGDGNADYQGYGNPPSTKTHTYTTAGSYNVILGVIDDESATALAFETVNVYTPPGYTLTIFSSPSGVTFTANGVSHTTPWSETYTKDASVNLVMPSTHSVGEARYYWDRWSDGVTSRSRTVVMDMDLTLTAYYTGPYYQLTVTSSPITGIPFTINGASKTTSYIDWLLQGSYTVEMPATYSGYTWSHWLEDGDTNRLKAFTLSSTKTLTAVYTTAPPPQPPYKPTAASQYRSDEVTVIPEGGTTPESTVVFKATVSDPDGDSVRLEIELRQIGEAFTGEPTPETISDFVQAEVK